MKTRVDSLEKSVSSVEDDVSDLQLDVSDIKASLRGHTEILSHINRVEITVAGITEKADSAHKRLDEEKAEIDLLRLRTHGHANDIQRHGGIIDGINMSIKNLITSTEAQGVKTDNNTKKLSELTTRADMIIIMGIGFFAFCGFVGSKLLHWW